MKEIKLIVKSLKYKKASGEDDINAGLLKISGKDLLKSILFYYIYIKQ